MRTKQAIPPGNWLYGIRTVHGRYIHAVGPDLESAARSAGIDPAEIRRSMPLKSGDAQARQRKSLKRFLKTKEG